MRNPIISIFSNIIDYSTFVVPHSCDKRNILFWAAISSRYEIEIHSFNIYPEMLSLAASKIYSVFSKWLLYPLSHDLNEEVLQPWNNNLWTFWGRIDLCRPWTRLSEKGRWEKGMGKEEKEEGKERRKSFCHFDRQRGNSSWTVVNLAISQRRAHLIQISFLCLPRKCIRLTGI